MKKINFFLIVFFILLMTVLRSNESVFGQDLTDRGKDRYIVVLQDSEKDAKKSAEDLSMDHDLLINHLYKIALNGFSAKVNKSKLESLKKDKRVRYVVEDKLVKLDASGGVKGKPKPSPTPTRIPTPTNTPTPSPTSTPLSISVAKPNGGEILSVGQTYRITWNSSINIDKVSLGYKGCSSCLDWIVTNIANAGYYDWNVNVGNTVNTQFLIYVIGYQTGYGSVSDTSDGYFTVLQPTLTLTLTPTATPTRTPTPTPTPQLQNIPLGVKRIGVNSTNNGQGITVAVLDTGIDLTHPDLVENIVANTSCISEAPTGNDDHGHGSHVAGTIAAVNNSTGVVGVASGAKLAAVKVLDSGGWGYWSEIICGIDWVTANASIYNIKVANMSLGGGGTSDNNCGYSNNDPLHQAICNSRNSGVTYVVSAGNDSKDAATAVPAAYDDAVITVSALADSDGKPGGLGATTSYGPDDTFASFSNYGSVVDIGAPGVSIRSTYKSGGYVYMSGTSMAAPHVSGSAALYIKTNPGAQFLQVKTGLLSVSEPLGNGHTDPSGLHPEPVVLSSKL